ncbi:hypothetical protein NH340_JMT05473, partial [Sarcoptes scabiei]
MITKIISNISLVMMMFIIANDSFSIISRNNKDDDLRSRSNDYDPKPNTTTPTITSKTDSNSDYFQFNCYYHLIYDSGHSIRVNIDPFETKNDVSFDGNDDMIEIIYVTLGEHHKQLHYRCSLIVNHLEECAKDFNNQNHRRRNSSRRQTKRLKRDHCGPIRIVLKQPDSIDAYQSSDHQFIRENVTRTTAIDTIMVNNMDSVKISDRYDAWMNITNLTSNSLQGLYRFEFYTLSKMLPFNRIFDSGSNNHNRFDEDHSEDLNH